jgi:hypothetical protein
MNQTDSIKEIKYILENFRTPEKLNDHPWVKSVVVQHEVENDPSLTQKNPGQQLVFSLVKLFRQLMPKTMPKHGKRLDTNWGQFGILAAQYFAPIVYGTVFPRSLRDAGGRIDVAISIFVFNKPVDELSEDEMERYQLIGDEVEFISVSTLSDWQNQGIIKLAEAFTNYENYLINNKATIQDLKLMVTTERSLKPQDNKKKIANQLKKQRYFLKWGQKKKGWIIGILVILVFLIIGVKVGQIIADTQPVLTDLRQLKSLVQISTSDDSLISRFTQANELISKSRIDLAVLHLEVQPYLWLGRGLSWVPKYGGDLAQADLLFDFADGTITSIDQVVQSIAPVFESIQNGKTVIGLSEITDQLVETQPKLAEARISLDNAFVAYKRLDVQKLSPSLKDAFTQNDNLLQLFDEGLNVGIALPRLLGATDEGPKTYVVLLQNEDELRATGGFITGAATVVIQDGKILSYKVEDSLEIDNPDQYYPPAPWQLERYMDASHWVFRDSNWSPDFPTAAKWAEMFIVTGQNYSADGFIGIDQEAVKFILAALGPINVDNVSYPITSDNVISYMRTAKTISTIDNQGVVHRKIFMAVLTEAILQKLEASKGVPWLSLFTNLKRALDERQLLLQLDDSDTSLFLAKLNWDGGVRAHTGDYLLVVDSNIGFSKVNAVVNENLKYEVDLSDLNTPKAILTAAYKNNATGQSECNLKRDTNSSTSQDLYDIQINRCLVDYLRVYKSAGVELIGSTPHVVPAVEMIPGNEAIPAKVDDLNNEDLNGIRVYGTLLLVPRSESLETSFTFKLPTSMLETTNNLVTYHLHIQKQSGTVALPITIKIDLPNDAEFVDASPKGNLEGNKWMLSTDLRQDIELSLTFKKP